MGERVLANILVVIVAYLVSTALVFPLRRLAFVLGALDYPGERKSQKHPVPLLGGLAIFLSIVIVVWTSLLWLPQLQDSWLSSHFSESLRALSNYINIQRKLWAIFAGAVIVTLVGLLDDLLPSGISPVNKLLGQAAAAAMLLPAGIYMDLLNWNVYLAMAVSVVWVVGITNAFNLLDNMDGLSSGIALICSFMFLVLVMTKGEFFIALLLSAVIGGTLGFFQFNLRQGFLYMGDAGSLLLGFMLGAISLMARYVGPADTSIFPVLAPLIILGLPLFDTASVIVIRLRDGRPVFKGDRMHLSHRLVRMGMSTLQAVLFNFLMAFTIAANALLIISSRALHSLVAVVQVVALMAMVSILMAMRNRNGAEGVNGTLKALDGAGKEEAELVPR
jgi:UDP-GlcNAc:undecaprenyl-phosphate GlcNAc-1-phosphate transferase